MKKIAFFLDNRVFSSVDCSDILAGNPGIGGTENMFYVIATLLSKRENGINVKIFLTERQKLPQGLDYEITNSLTSCITKVYNESFDFLIIKHDVQNIYNNVLKDASTLKVQIIIWAHIFMCYWELDYYANLKNVYKIVNVGREALDLYIDHPAYNKSCFIYNCIPLSNLTAKYLTPFNKRKHIVTYIGQLSSFKGFHLLAEAWPKVIKEIPDAELYVIGTGKLYNKNSKLGTYGLAESSYEKKFIKYIIDEEGKIIPGVHFMGVMGKEKDAILSKTKVGVPNPSGITETFCISAVEMQIHGAFITTIKAPGYLDTVKNGILFSNRKKLAETIIKALRMEKCHYEKAILYFKNEFSYETVSGHWENLINNGELHYEKGNRNLCYRFKWLKRYLRICKNICPFLSSVPYLERMLLFVERKLKGPVTYFDSEL